MAESKTATTDPFAMDPWRQEPWSKAMTQAFRFWISFWPVAPLFGVEWRFAEMGRTFGPLGPTAEATPAAGTPVEVTIAEDAPAEEAPADEPSGEQAPATPDDLTRIKGIGPGLARQLDALGIRSFRQIAALSDAELVAIDEKLTSIKGRCFRDDWIGQAKALAG